MDKTQWYKLSPTELFTSLDSRPAGLDETVAAQRLEEYGPNELEFRKTPAWLRFGRQFNEPMVIILLLTAVVTGTLTAMGSPMLPDTIVIASVVLLNAVLGFIQEGKAEGALDALRNMMVQECLVLRERVQRRIPARELVPGDIVVLEGGDKIPADVRFLEVNNIHVDESSLTGESVPVQKQVDALEGENLVPGDRRNMGFSGTFLTQGTDPDTNWWESDTLRTQYLGEEVSSKRDEEDFLFARLGFFLSGPLSDSLSLGFGVLMQSYPHFFGVRTAVEQCDVFASGTELCSGDEPEDIEPLESSTLNTAFLWLSEELDQHTTLTAQLYGHLGGDSGHMPFGGALSVRYAFGEPPRARPSSPGK